MNISSKRQTARLVRAEVSARVGRPMTNKAARKWLKKSKRQPLVIEKPTFHWPQVKSFPTMYLGQASFVRFPHLRPTPFGWKRLTMPGITEAIDLPLWLWWSMVGINHAKKLFWSALAYVIGLRKVKA